VQPSFRDATSAALLAFFVNVAISAAEGLDDRPLSPLLAFSLARAPRFSSAMMRTLALSHPGRHHPAGVMLTAAGPSSAPGCQVPPSPVALPVSGPLW